MSDLDPFADAAFVSRLQKLMSMIGSAQPAEAEAARRKLLEHLSHHRLSLTDVAIRLGEAPKAAVRQAPFASFTQGARELHLERQLGIARSAKQEAEAEASLSLVRLRELQQVLQHANIDMARLMSGHVRMRALTAGACALAAGCLMVALLSHLPGRGAAEPFTVVHEGPVTLSSQGRAPAMPARAAERVGYVAVQDLAVRLTPNDDAGVRAFLNSGERVVIMHQSQIGQQQWLFIRSETGSGWVRAGDIEH